LSILLSAQGKEMFNIRDFEKRRALNPEHDVPVFTPERRVINHQEKPGQNQRLK